MRIKKRQMHPTLPAQPSPTITRQLRQRSRLLFEATESRVICPPTWIRTRDPLLKRQLLYQLSYRRLPKIVHNSEFFGTVGQVGIEPTSLAGHDLKSCAYTNSATDPLRCIQREATAGLEPAHKSFADSRVTPSPRGRVRTNDERLPMTTHKTKETIAQTRTPSPRGHVSNAQRANYTITFSLIHRYAGDFSRLSL